MLRQRLKKDIRSGGNGGGDTPVPIPNTTVKPSSAESTWTAGSWEARTLPGKRELEDVVIRLPAFLFDAYDMMNVL